MPNQHLAPLTGEDVADIINANGGDGAFEEAPEAGTVDRWLFPRFIPNCPVCATPLVLDHDSATYEPCPNDGTVYVMDDADKYLSRTGIGGYDTDVETIGGWLSAPRNIVGMVLVLGEPGTGKTAMIEAAVTHLATEEHPRPMTTVVCTPDHTKDSLFLRFVGEGKGDPVDPDCDSNDPDFECERGPYTLGPVPYAAKHGHILYMDEAMLLVDGVKPILYSLADGRHYLPEGNVDGSALEIHEDFRLILSSNPMVRGASLPEPLSSRAASTTVTVVTDGNMLRDLGITEDIVAAWEALGQQKLFRPQIREVRLADYWFGLGSVTQAVSAFIPEHCPESERTQVRDLVLSYLGGTIREDGRLIVK